MTHFWKLGTTLLIILLAFAIAPIALATDQQVDSQRYNLPYNAPLAKTTTATSTKTKATKKATATSSPAATAPKTNKKPAKPATVANKTTAPLDIYSKQVVQETRNFPYFSAINVVGPFRVNITSGDGRQRVALSGNINAIPRVTAFVRGDTLVIGMLPSKTGKLVPPYDPRVTVQINMPYELASITVGGTTQVYGSGVYSSHLLVTTADQSSVYLRGNIVVDKIICNSSGFIDLAVGHVRGVSVGGQGSGMIRISGNADVLVAAIGGWLQLDAARLRSRTVYINTWGAAVGQVQPVVSLYAFARDSSSVYYYKQPQIIAGSSKNSGNILRLANWR